LAAALRSYLLLRYGWLTAHTQNVPEYLDKKPEPELSIETPARQGRAGLGIYITQEEQILNSHQQVVMRRCHTVAVFPEKQFPHETKDPE
jgi:hypothetical protein